MRVYAILQFVMMNCRLTIVYQCDMMYVDKRKDEKRERRALLDTCRVLYFDLNYSDLTSLSRQKGQKQMGTQRYHWIGQEGQLFKRVSLVFEGLGFTPPTLDTTTEGSATGAYVSNIEEQYRTNLSLDEIIQIIDYAKANTLENLQHAKSQGWIDREEVFR